MGKVISCYNEHFYSDTFNFVSAGQVVNVVGLVEWVLVDEIILNLFNDAKPNC